MFRNLFILFYKVDSNSSAIKLAKYISGEKESRSCLRSTISFYIGNLFRAGTRAARISRRWCVSFPRTSVAIIHRKWWYLFYKRNVVYFADIQSVIRARQVFPDTCAQALYVFALEIWLMYVVHSSELLSSLVSCNVSPEYRRKSLLFRWIFFLLAFR